MIRTTSETSHSHTCATDWYAVGYDLRYEGGGGVQTVIIGLLTKRKEDQLKIQLMTFGGKPPRAGISGEKAGIGKQFIGYDGKFITFAK